MFNDFKDFLETPINALAIFIEKISSTQNHTGIIAKKGNNINVYHLAWHQKLKRDSWDEYYARFQTSEKCKKWVRFTYLNSSEVGFQARISGIITILDTIYKKNASGIPYGFNFKNSIIDKDNVLKLGFEEFGLTCATFVACFFNSVSIRLVDLNTWKLLKEDTVWKNKIIEIMKMDCSVNEKHIEDLKSEPLNYRLRPEQIAVASNFDLANLPASYEQCYNLGNSFNTLYTNESEGTEVF